MLTRLLFLLSLASVSVFLLTGAWTGSLSSSTRITETPFVPQAMSLDADVIGSGIDAKQLLQKALDTLSPERTRWLKTKIRQTMADADSNFVAEGFLLRGPNHCARLEMKITTNGKPGRMIVVSDGEVIAQERNFAGTKPAVVVEALSVTDPTAKEELLGSKSCGGPLAVLQQLHLQLQNARLQTGILQNQPVIQIKGELTPGPTGVCACTTIPVRHAYVYLNAKTLWPTRMEWWGVDDAKVVRPILTIEFLDPEINHELSAAECERQFSYQP